MPEPISPSPEVVAAARVLAAASPFWSLHTWEDIPATSKQAFYRQAEHSLETLARWRTESGAVENPSASRVDRKMSRVLLAVEIEQVIRDMGNRDLLLPNGGMRHHLVRWARALRDMP